MLENLTWTLITAQAFSLLGLGLCIAGFGSTRDERLLVLLISANVAFAIHFVLFESWTAAVLTMLIVLRIVLARRYPKNTRVMAGMLALSLLAAAFTWRTAVDILPLTAMVLGTVAMFMLRGIPLRLMLAAAALSWMLNNLLIGSIGGVITEGVILTVNMITLMRLRRAYRQGLLVPGG